MQKRLLINIGNTHTSFVACESDQFVECIKTDTKAILDWTDIPLNLADYDSIWASSVVSQVRAHLSQICAQVNWISVNLNSPLKFDHYDPQTLGNDRFANAVAAAMSFESSVMVIDCGTAITTEVINAEKQFLGGVILPGLSMSYNALNQNTSLLPLLENEPQLSSVIAKNTENAIKAGVQNAAIGALEKIIAETKSALNDTLSIIITGGDKAFFSTQLGFPATEDFFTFKGIKKVAEQNEKT